MEWQLRGRLGDLLIAAALVAGQLWRLAGIEAAQDLHPADAAGQLHAGCALFAGAPPPWWLAWSPLSSALLGLLHFCGVPLMAVQDVGARLVSLASTLALWWVVRPLVGRTASAVVALWWSTGALATHAEGSLLPPPCYLMGAALAWLGCGWLWRGRLGPGLAMVVLASLERGEVAALFLAGATAVAVGTHVSAVRRRALLVVAVALPVLAFQLLATDCRARGWLAFRQHYAEEVARRQPGTDGSGFAAPDATIARDFPGAASVAAAVRSNPVAVVRHAGHNLRWLPEALAVVVQPAARRPWWSLGAATGAVAIGWLAVAGRRRRLRQLLRRRAAWLVGLGAAALAGVGWCLLLMPRPCLLLGAVPLLATLAGTMLRALAPTPRQLTGVSLGTLLVACPPPADPLAVGAREVRAAAALLARQQFQPGERVAMLHAGTMAVYAWPRSIAPVDLAHLAAAAGSPDAFPAAFAAAGVDRLLVSPAALGRLGAMAAPLLAELAAESWEIADGWYPVLVYQRRR